MSAKNPPYSARSFLYIDARESRRRKTPASDDSSVRPDIDKLRDIRNQVADAKNRNDEAALDNLVEQRTDVRKQRDQKFKELFSQLELDFKRDISDHKFRWNLKAGRVIETRHTFQIDKDVPHFYVAKQCEQIIRKALRNQASNRNTLVRALHDSLTKDCTFGVIRTDIEHFYDTIPHNKLKMLLREHTYLDPITIELVDLLLDEYSELTGTPVGLPQGVSICASLSEMYLEHLDHQLRIANGVLFYARYVDDIVLVVEDPGLMPTIESLIKKELDRIGLKENEEKTKSIRANDQGRLQAPLDYLGYTFTDKVQLSKKSFERKLARLNKTFEAWAPHPTDGLASKLLIQRLLFLTSNFRLHNSKSNAIAGLYFSNQLLPTDSDQLQQLDKHLASQLKQHASEMPEELHKRLERFSFVAQFKERTFVAFKAGELHTITTIWER